LACLFTFLVFFVDFSLWNFERMLKSSYLIICDAVISMKLLFRHILAAEKKYYSMESWMCGIVGELDHGYM